jgi:uncharacterized membrane protein required for colicin V production
LGLDANLGATLNGAVVLDIAIGLLVVGSFIAGARRGLIVGVFGLIGYVGGAIGAMALAPHLLNSIDGPLKRALLTGLLVLFLASVGESIMSRAAGGVRRVVLWGPLRFIDSLLGGITAVLSVVLLIWIFATLGNLVGSTSISSLLNRSELVKQFDQRIPNSLATWAKREAMHLMG